MQRDQGQKHPVKADCIPASRQNKRRGKAHGWGIHQFLGNDVSSQVCICSRCPGKKDRTYRAHLKCISNAVLRTPFKEGIIAWDQRGKVNGESNGLRLKTLESCHKWAGAHQRVHMDPILCISVVIL